MTLPFICSEAVKKNKIVGIAFKHINPWCVCERENENLNLPSKPDSSLPLREYLLGDI